MWSVKRVWFRTSAQEVEEMLAYTFKGKPGSRRSTNIKCHVLPLPHAPPLSLGMYLYPPRVHGGPLLQMRCTQSHLYMSYSSTPSARGLPLVYAGTRTGTPSTAALTGFSPSAAGASVVVVDTTAAAVTPWPLVEDAASPWAAEPAAPLLATDATVVVAAAPPASDTTRRAT